jgi:hypothetical protein
MVAMLWSLGMLEQRGALPAIRVGDTDIHVLKKAALPYRLALRLMHHHRKPLAPRASRHGWTQAVVCEFMVPCSVCPCAMHRVERSSAVKSKYSEFPRGAAQF